MIKRDDIIAAIRSDGGGENGNCMATWRISRRLDATSRSVRAELLHMERDGLVRRHRYSTCNNTIWELVPEADSGGDRG